jgi:hypothetical protein
VTSCPPDIGVEIIDHYAVVVGIGHEQAVMHGIEGYRFKGVKPLGRGGVIGATLRVDRRTVGPHAAELPQQVNGVVVVLENHLSGRGRAEPSRQRQQQRHGAWAGGVHSGVSNSALR